MFDDTEDHMNHPAPRADGALVLRPGVLMPDWYFVMNLASQAAIIAGMAASGRAEKWSGLERVAVVEQHPPDQQWRLWTGLPLSPLTFPLWERGEASR